MKNINAIAGPLLALGFWLLAAQPGQCFYNQGACARASTPAPDGAAIGTPPVQHEYGPFGEVIRATGPMAKANPFRFSTKYQDDETDLLYYGYRYYNASTGRWLSRDPVGEEAFFQIYTTSWTWRERQRARIETLKPAYSFLANDSIDSIDAFGLLRFDPKCSPSDIEKMKKELKDRCQKAKAGNCYRCLDQKYQNSMQKMCDEIDKNTGPMVVCEDASTDKDCKNRTMCGWQRAGKIHICVDLMQDTTISCSLPGCTLLHEAGHQVGGVGDDSPPKRKHPEAYAIEKCAGCPDPPKGVVLPPGY
jgi:RHS repeat-associated protein